MQHHPVGFTAPDDTVRRATDHRPPDVAPPSVLKGLAPRDTVEIDGVIYQVRSTRAVGDARRCAHSLPGVVPCPATRSANRFCFRR